MRCEWVRYTENIYPDPQNIKVLNVSTFFMFIVWNVFDIDNDLLWVEGNVYENFVFWLRSANTLFALFFFETHSSFSFVYFAAGIIFNYIESRNTQKYPGDRINELVRRRKIIGWDLTLIVQEWVYGKILRYHF